MFIMKAQNEDEDQSVAEEVAKAFMLDANMNGVKKLRRGSAVLWLETAYNNVQTAAAMEKHGLHDVDLIGDDEEVFLASL